MLSKKYLLIPAVLLSSLGFIFSTSHIYAEDTFAAKPSVTGKIQYKCATVTEKINALSYKYSKQKDAYSQRYRTVSEKTTEAIKTLESKGYDVSVVKADLEVFNQKLQKFTSDFALYHDKLGNSKNYVCGSSGGDFLKSLDDSRAQLKVVRADAIDLRTYYQNNLRPAIQDLKKQVITDKNKD